MLAKVESIVRMCAFGTTDRLANATPPRMACMLFYLPGLMSHECIPNASWTRVENPDNTFSIKVWAAVDIKAGEKISLQYLDITRPQMEKKFHLQEVYNWTCSCRLCSDSTQFGTYYGAVKCAKCKNGNMVSIEPLKFSDADWKCESCGNKSPYRLCAVPLETTVFEEILKCNESEEFEKVLETYAGKTLHPNHWLMMDCRQEIVKRMYSFITTIKPAEKMVESAQKMLEHCKALNTRIELIYPGQNRLRARHILFTKFAEVVAKGEAPDFDAALDKIEQLVRKGEEMNIFQENEKRA